MIKEDVIEVITKFTTLKENIGCYEHTRLVQGLITALSTELKANCTQKFYGALKNIAGEYHALERKTIEYVKEVNNLSCFLSNALKNNSSKLTTLIKIRVKIESTNRKINDVHTQHAVIVGKIQSISSDVKNDVEEATEKAFHTTIVGMCSIPVVGPLALSIATSEMVYDSVFENNNSKMAAGLAASAAFVSVSIGGLLTSVLSPLIVPITFITGAVLRSSADALKELQVGIDKVASALEKDIRCLDSIKEELENILKNQNEVEIYDKINILHEVDPTVVQNVLQSCQILQNNCEKYLYPNEKRT